MIAGNGKGHGFLKLRAMVNEYVTHEAPELDTFAVAYTQLENDSCQSRYIVTRQSSPCLGRQDRVTHPTKTIKSTLIVFSWAVDCSHDRLITFDKPSRIHLGYKIQGAISVVSIALGKQPTFAFQPPPKLCVRQRIQQPNHCQRNRALANKVYLALKNIFGIIVKADNKTGHDFHPVALNFLN